MTFRAPGLSYERAPCPRCGAVTAAEAEGRCQPTRDHTDEWTCPGDEEDAEGFLMQPTAASIEALDAWVTAEAKREGWIA